MAYFNRKDIIRILAEKPDMISSFPESVLSSKQCDDMALIPDIALCDITMTADLEGLDQLFQSTRPDAILPSVMYCGIERVDWGGFEAIVAELKRALEQKWHVHVLPPVVLGAPMFRSALCQYAEMQHDQQTRQEIKCAACFFYRVSSYIPLCKKCAISSIYFGSNSLCRLNDVNLLQTMDLLKYCKILLSGYGIELRMTTVANESCVFEKTVLEARYVQEFECLSDTSGWLDMKRTRLTDEILKNFFENYAIPYGANVMSRLLAGHEVDFVASARSFLPAVHT